MAYNSASEKPSAFVNPGAGLTRGIVSDLSILKPQYYNKFISKYGSQNYTMLLEMLGFKGQVKSNVIRHFEDLGKMHQAVQVASNATSSTNGDAVTFTLTAGSHYGSPTANKSAIRVGEIIEVASTGIQGKVISVDKTTSPTAHQVVVRPLSSSQRFQSAAVAGRLDANEWILFRGQAAVGEASSKGDALIPRVEEVVNYVSEIREDWRVTDRAMIEEIWFAENYSYKGLDEAVKRFMNNKEFTLMFGNNITNTAASSTSNNTIGLLNQIENRGTGVSYTAGSLDRAKLHEVTRALDFNGGSMENHLLSDVFLRQELDDELFDLYDAGAILWGTVGGSKEAAAMYGFGSITMDGYTFHIKKYLPFSPEAVYGATPTDHQYKNYGIVVPMSQGRDPQSGERYNSIEITYNNVNGKDLHVWETGAFAKSPTSDTAELNVHHLCYAGLRVFGANRFVRISG
jgi:hypothetical protein